MTAQMNDKEIIVRLFSIMGIFGLPKEDKDALKAAISRLQFYSALLQKVGLDIDAYLSDNIMGDEHSSVDWQKVFRKTSANLDAAFNQEEE